MNTDQTPQSPLDLPNVQPDKANPIKDMVYSPATQQSNNMYRLERGVIRLRNGKTVAATQQFKGAPLYGKVNSSVITKNPGVLSIVNGAVQAIGSVPPAITSPAYALNAADPTHLTISWPAYANRLIDGTALILPAGSITISGLTANTLYNYYPFWSVPAQAQGWVQGGVGNPAIAFTALLDSNLQIQILQQNLSFGSIFFTQPASGSGSGNTGGSGGGGSTGGGGRHNGPSIY